MAPLIRVKPKHYLLIPMIKQPCIILSLTAQRNQHISCGKKLGTYKCKMKGDRKRCKNYFKCGNKYSKGSKKGSLLGATAEYVRPTPCEAELLQSDPVMDVAMSSISTEDSKHSVVKLLRPRKNRSSYFVSNNERKDKEVNTITDCNKLFHVGKLWAMINCVTRQHRESYPYCHGDLAFDPSREKQRGIVWREAVMCNRCQYRSEMFNLYKEVEAGYTTGRKAAAANVGINIALTQTPIAASSLTKILAGGNIKPPSARGITHMNKKVRNRIITENRRDMSQRLQQLKKLNRWKGRPETHIAAEVDGVYTNSLYSGVGRTPFQPATQCTLTVCENLTPKKQIVAVETVNKLCSKSGFHTQDDEEECDIKSDRCSATASMETNIGDEAKWAEYCFHDLKTQEGIEIKYLTSDGDGKACEGARCLFEDGITTIEPVQQLDTRHLGANHRKYIKSSSKVTDIMPGRTKAYRMYIQNKFAVDLSQRCHAEMSFIVKNSVSGSQNLLDKTRDCMVMIKNCYAGNHVLCGMNSGVCKGDLDNNWIKNSIYLPKGFKINTENQDHENTLMELVEYRLGDQTVNLTRLNRNSQKVEATNRAIKRSLPRDKTFSRCYESRVHSALHSVNNGPGVSLRKLCKASGCPIPTGSQVDRTLDTLQRDSERKKERERSLAYEIKRKARRNRLYKLYERHQEEKKYVKNQLTRFLNIRRQRRQLQLKSNPLPANDHDKYSRDPSINSRKRRQNPIRAARKETPGFTSSAGTSTRTLTAPKVIKVWLNKKTDIYSLGIMMYEMAHMDKEAILPQMILFKIVHQTLPTMPTDYSSGVTDLLTLMINKDPRQRPSAKEMLSHSIFKTTKKPPPVPSRKNGNLDDVAGEDREDGGIKTILGTLTQLYIHDSQRPSGGGAAKMMEASGGRNTQGDDEYEDNPVMQLVKRTLADMGHGQTDIRGRSILERKMEMLKVYCLHCLDNNRSLFKRACDALDKSHSEDEIEELLIRVLGHEKYGLCGVQLLHYKNFTYNLRS